MKHTAMIFVASLTFLACDAFCQVASERWKPQWFVVLEDRSLSASKAGPIPAYRVKVLRAVGKEQRLQVVAGLAPELDAQMAFIVEAMCKSFELPKLDEDGNFLPSGNAPSTVVFVLRRYSRNRQLEIAFGDQELATKEARTAIERLLATANEQLDAAGVTEKVALPPIGTQDCPCEGNQ